MKLGFARAALLSGALATMTACGGGGGSSTTSGSIGPSPTPTPTPVASCSLRARQDWATDTLREWYLFPETLPASPDPAPYSTLDDYVDALTATARSQGRDRYFTYVTSIREENAYYESGSSAGFGVRFATDATGGRLFVIEAFENGPALAAGIDRGAEIMAIGTGAGDLRTVASLHAAGGYQAVSDALGPDDAGTTRMLRVEDASGTRNVSVTKRDYDLLPLSSRYGSRIIEDGGRRVGYLNLRSFILSADQPLRDAFATFRAQGVTEVIVDLRYNGGGLVSVARLVGDLLGANRASSDIFTRLTFRPEKSDRNETSYFGPQPQAIAATKIAFIGGQGSASASEVVINAFLPFIGDSIALVGTNTYGKPVGQIAIDRAACDDRLRVVAFATQNAAGNADYYRGLASSMRTTCQSYDDIYHPLGDPNEASTRQALDYLAGRSCVPIGTASSALRTSAPALRPERDLLTPRRPSAAQREVPGLF